MPGKRGKWGITRDSDGSLSLLWEWPWYWRYPAAAVICVAGLLLAYWAAANDSREWLPWAIGVAATFLALIFAYEAGCLVIVLVFLGGIWLLVETLVPDVKVAPQWIAIIGLGAAYYAWYVGNEARIRVVKAQRGVDNTWQRMNRLEEEARVEIGRLNRRVDFLEARLEKLGADDSGFEYL